MNRKTNKKLKQEIRTLKNEVYNLSIRLHMANMMQYHPCPPFKIKATIHRSECLYPEQAYPILRRDITSIR